MDWLLFCPPKSVRLFFPGTGNVGYLNIIPQAFVQFDGNRHDRRLTGNIQVSLTGHTESPFAWLEPIALPLLVLSTAYVLKEQVLGAIEVRHANEQAFQSALADWQIATANPEDHPQWAQCYANALRDLPSYHSGYGFTGRSVR